MPDQQKIAELFIRVQHCRERAWGAHIRRRDRTALEQATLMQLAATELVRQLAEEADVVIPLA